MLWIALTIAAAPLQVGRNVMQRGLVGDAGPWGATLVRFMFGLPFALVIFGLVAAFTPGAAPHLSARFVIAILIGALGQILATAALLVSMHRTSFAIATVTQLSALPLAALSGWAIFGDSLGVIGTLGLLLTTAALVGLSWPERDQTRGATVGAMFGLLSGVAFAITQNGFRQAGLALEPRFPIYSATASVCIAQGMQTVALLIYLAVTRPAALAAVAKSWRASLGAGAFGAAASACWFGALALAPAGAVRAVGVIEAPIAAAVGRRLFRERLSLRQLIGGACAAVGVAMCALGQYG